jgi:hypothetical protein
VTSPRAPGIGTGHHLRPSVSSLTDPVSGQRFFMVGCHAQMNALDPDVRGTIVASRTCTG